MTEFRGRQRSAGVPGTGMSSSGSPGASDACETFLAKFIVQQCGLSCPGSWANTGVGLCLWTQTQKEPKS